MKKKTITLNCTNCGNDFEKCKHEVARRRAKLPGNEHWFCDLSCTATFRNTGKPARAHIVPHPGNDYGRRYPEEVSWYVSRCSKDKRFGLMEKEERRNFVTILQDQWLVQKGLCAYTGVALVRRPTYGNEFTETNTFLIASVDRIDGSKGYELGNVQWVSIAMNRARNDTSDENFKKFLKVIK